MGIAPTLRVWNGEACGAPRHLRASLHGGGAVRARRAQTISPPAPRSWWSPMVRYWLPPLLWMAVMFWLSTDTFAAERTGGLLWRTLSTLAPRVTDAQYAWLHFGIRKAAHLTEYALLAVLLLRALRAGAAAAWHWRWALLAVLLVAAHALLDEYHQSFTQSRTASEWDSLLDIAGGLVGLFLLWLRRRRPAVPLAGRKRG
jgi:MYXO-CTERM domain-containing protein